MPDALQLPDPGRLPVRLDERQQRIHRRLLLIGPGPAAFFQDACTLFLNRLPISSTSHLVGHLLREIESAMRAVMKSATVDSQPDPPPSSNHQSEIEQVLTALEISKDDPIAGAWLCLSEKANDYALHRLAHRDCLAAPRLINDEFREFWGEILTLLDFVLGRFESRYLAIMPTLDDLLDKQTPTRADAALLKNNVPNNLATIGYFFGKLENPAWLGPLRQEGFFTRPPEPIVNELEQTRSFPPWPVLRYLRRMAPREPELVASIATEIPLTDNAGVHHDLLEIALDLPSEQAANLVPHLKHGIECRHHGILFTHKLGNLLLHLSTALQNTSVVLDLARSAFAVIPDAEESENAGTPSRRFSRSRTRMDEYEYERIVAQTAKELTTRYGRPVFEMFSDLLEHSVSVDQHKENPADREDWSYIWCQDVEHCSGEHDVKCSLIAAVRDAAKCLLEGDSMSVRDVVLLFEARSWRVFDRVALHLLRLFPDDTLAIERLLHRDAFDDATLRREYNDLMAATFGRLAPHDQATVLGWIDKGPDLDEYCDGTERWIGKRPTEQEVRSYADHWRLKQLHPIRESLPGNWRERYDALVTQLGVPQLYPPTSTVSWGWQSPLQADQIRSMEIRELLDYLKAWTPSPDDHFGPCRKGLADSLQKGLAEEPGRFVAVAEKFEDLHPAYLSALLSGLKDTVKKTWQTEWWDPILRLCLSIVTKTNDAAENAGAEERPERWLRQSVASIVGLGLEQHDSQIPFALREHVWSIIEPLTNDPDPPPDDEQREGEDNLDPMTRSLNCVRGEAMHAVIKYALWIRRNFDAKQLAGCTPFEEMPEVRTVLDVHLDPSIERSLAIRSVYGQWFPWLCLLDECWAASHVNVIFPIDAGRVELWDAAWLPYIVFCAPYNGVFQLLRKQYEHSIIDIQREVPYKVAGNAGHREQLGEHLMILYGRGSISVGESADLLSLFFTKAPSKVREHALAFVGRSLNRENGQIPSEVLDRFQNLWTHRVNALKDIPDRAQRSELTAFGWWFVCGKFDQRWTLDRMQESLELCGWTEPDHAVIKQLAALAEEHPQEAIECLSMLVEGDKNGWALTSWNESARTILAAALRSDLEVARQNATALVNRLCARGYHEFRTLISCSGVISPVPS